MSIRPIFGSHVRVAATMCLVAGVALVGTASSVGAQSGCGEYSYGFAGTRLINDGISNSAGPFTIDLPAGTYDIVLHSHDAHDEHPGQIDQTMEQWYFELDSGYVSPLSADVPDDANTSVASYSAQEIGASTSITLHHRGEGSVNSVDPVCVGLTTVQVDPTVAPPTTAPSTTAPTTTAPPQVSPATTAPANPVVTTEVVPSTTIPPTVAGAVQEPPATPQLALTGPSSLTLIFAVAGLTMLLAGAGILLDERASIRR